MNEEANIMKFNETEGKPNVVRIKKDATLEHATGTQTICAYP
jgi:hypothetical protein